MPSCDAWRWVSLVRRPAIVTAGGRVSGGGKGGGAGGFGAPAGVGSGGAAADCCCWAGGGGGGGGAGVTATACQSGDSSSAALAATFTGSDPSVAIVQMSPWASSRSDVNARRVPSGAHDGPSSWTALLV